MKEKIIKRIWLLEAELRTCNDGGQEYAIKRELDFLRDLILTPEN